MMQPGTGVVPHAMGQQAHYYPPQQSQQPYMMMPPQPPTAQAPQMWAAQAQVGPPPPQASQQIPQSQSVPPTSAEEVRTLWIGDLQYWMEESYLFNCFAHTGELVNAKVIRSKQTGQSEGYAFLEFVNHPAAERILQTYNGTPMPNGAKNFRLNWASAGEKRSEDSTDHTIFVGDLASDVTDYMLQETFRARYPSVKGAKVVIDRLTGRTKGYGFVRFGDESEQLRATTEMNGVLCSSRPMRIGLAANKNPVGQQYSKASYQNSQGAQNENDPNNTTIFVGNLDSNITDDHLRQIFCQYGELLHVKIPAGKRCGFVQFADRGCAEEALRNLNGTQLGGQNIRLSWGRSPNKQGQADANQHGGYGYAAGQDNYSYAPVTQDPSMYYGGYPGYANYQPQPQQQQQQQVGYS